MFSDSSSSQQWIPHSTVYLSLYVQNPNVDEVQGIYVKGTPAKDPIQKIAETSLRLFLEKTPLMPSKKWYDVVRVMEVPNRGEIPIHFWLPKDHDLKVGVLDQNLQPHQGYMGILTITIFNQSGIMSDFREIQSQLTHLATEGSSYQTSLQPISTFTLSKPYVRKTTDSTEMLHNLIPNPSFSSSFSSSGFPDSSSSKSDDLLPISPPSPRRVRRNSKINLATEFQAETNSEIIIPASEKSNSDA
ncbi:MAG: hypothetical protein ACHQUC_01215 [Chlamydiales bacterium]